MPHLRPWRVHFEARHLLREAYLNATALLSAHGYGHVWGSWRAEVDTWHLIASAEPKVETSESQSAVSVQVGSFVEPSLATRTSETMTNH